MEQKTETAFPMKGGEGDDSYAKYSTYQKNMVDGVKEMINEGIAKHLDIKHLCSSFPAIYIADLGCSIGPNTFFAVQNIIEGIEHLCQSQSLSFDQMPEFQVFFSDHVSNDFNKLFASFPPEKQYFASGVPGSFYNRLFPKASLHFVHSSISLHWLSKVPKQLEDVNSPAYNKGRIFYGGAPKEVVEAYLSQSVEDMEFFFDARAKELVSGGLMAVVLPTIPQEGFPHAFDLLGSCLMEMAKKGRLSESKVDSFNVPVYIPSVEEFEEAIKRNNSFSIERLELLRNPSMETSGKIDGQQMKGHSRALFEGLISRHFGSEIMDELVDLFTEKMIQIYEFESRFNASLYVLLKRK